MKKKSLIQVIIVLTLLVSLIGTSQPVSANADPQYRDILQTGPSISVAILPTPISLNETAIATVSFKDVPAGGYTSAEFSCTYRPDLIQVSAILVMGLFGPDSVTAIHGPQDGKFIVAIAGSQGHRATADGPIFTFQIKGLQTGQVSVDCTARVSNGQEVLSQIGIATANVLVMEATATPAPSLTPVGSPSPTSDWLKYRNTKYWFEFFYPSEGYYANNSMTDNHLRIILPFTQGTVLYEKYLDVTIVEDSNLCRSPLLTSSTLISVGVTFVNGVIYLQESGVDRTPELINRWFALSTYRDSACVTFDLVLRATNPDSLSTPPPFFDAAAEAAILFQVIGTFRWLPLPTGTVGGPTLSTSTAAAGESPTPIFTPSSTTGTITGQVLAGQRVTLTLLDARNRPIASILANTDGTFSLTAQAGTYNLIADTHGFLSATGSVTITGGSTSTQPTITLLAGDIDGDYTINQFDALTIGMNYNKPFPISADLNNDGIINVLDLEILAVNYHKIGPISW